MQGKYFEAIEATTVLGVSAAATALLVAVLAIAVIPSAGADRHASAPRGAQSATVQIVKLPRVDVVARRPAIAEPKAASIAGSKQPG